MKLSAITGRASNKDYIDLYFISQKIGFKQLLDQAKNKFKNIDINLILKSLVYFDDIEEDEIIYKNNNDINFSEIKKFLIEKVKNQA